MGLTCQVTRNKAGKIETVEAFNGSSSALYRTILAEHPELTEEEALKHYAKFYTNAFLQRYGDFTEGVSTLEVDDNGEPVYNQEELATLRLSNKLESGFLKDFNITVHEFEAINNKLKGEGSISDFIGKVINTTDKTDLTQESVFFAYLFLGKENNKLKSELRHTIRSWDQYEEKFDQYTEQIKDAYGFIPDRNLWFNKVRDQIIVDFLAEELVRYNNAPEAFEEKGRERWSQEDFTVIKNLIRWIQNFFAELNKGKSNIKKRIRLSNAARNVVHEMLNQDYRILNYKLGEDQVQTYYEDIIQKDPFAEDIINKGRDLGLIATGSLALRLQGDVFRTVDEQLHDLDFSVPYKKMLEQKALLDKLMTFTGPDSNVFAMKAVEILQEYDWFKDFKKEFPDFSFTNAFVNGEDVTTIQGVIDGKFYDKAGTHEVTDRKGKVRKVKHKKGDYIAGTGYSIDFFLRLKPKQESHYNNFKHWRDVITAKVILARDKDLVDHKYFVPYNQDINQIDFSTPEYVYTRDLSVVDKPTAVKQEDTMASQGETVADPYAYEFSVERYNNDQAANYVQSLSTALNVPYEYVSAVEAQQITEDSANPWSGQPAFFYKNKVYFVGNSVNPELALHEFSHPLVRYIKTVNRPLFNSLYEQIMQTTEGRQLYQEAVEEYGGITDRDTLDIIKEEVIVKALTRAAVAEKTNAPVSKKFDSFIQKVLYHIKQFLRKIFGRKVKVEKLTANTSLVDLAKMLAAGDKFNVNTELLSEEDIVAYNNQKKAFADEMNKAYKNKKEELGIFTDEHFDAIKQQYNLVIRNKNFEQLKPILANEAGRGYIAESMKIKKYTTEKELDPEAKELIAKLGEIEYMEKKVNALVDNMLIMDHMSGKIKEYLDSFKEDPDQQDAMREIYHYSRLTNIWEKWLDRANTTLANEGVDSNSELRTFLGGIRNRLNDIDKLVQDVMVNAVTDVITLVNPLNDVLEANYLAEKERLEALIKNSSGKAKESYERRLKQEKEKFDENYLTDEKIKLYLAGAIVSDNNVINSWLVNYIGNPDPVVGSLGKFLKDHYTNVQVRAHVKYNDFANTMDKVMKDAGYAYNATNMRKLADDVLMQDEVGFIDPETGEFESYQVHTFKNDYKGYKLALAQYSYNIKTAKQKFDATKNPEDEEKYAQALSEYEHHVHLYFQSKYKDEIYEIDNALLEDRREVVQPDGTTQMMDVGAIGKTRMDEIIDEIQELEKETVYSDKIDALQTSDTRAAKWRKYRYLFSERDEFGNKKEGLDLAIAQALKDHRARKNEFYEWKPIKGAFETALEGVEAEIEVRLENRDIKKTDPEYQEEFDKMKQEWLDVNTRIKIKDEFYEKRGNILAQIKMILDQLEKKRLKASKDKGYDYEGMVRFDEVWQNINDVISGRRDNDGQPVGSDMTGEAIDYVKVEQERMRDAKKSFIKLSGLTEDEYAQLENYFDTIRSKDPVTGKKGKLSKEDSARFQALLARKDDLGLDPLIKQTLISLWGALETLQSKVPTEYYMDVADRWYQNAIRPNISDDAPSNLTTEGAKDMLEPEFIEEFLAMEGNEDFAKWFKENHILTDKWYPDLKLKKPVYERVHVWNVVRPNDDQYYETTEIIKDDGTKEMIDGVPTLQYSYRTVKPEWMTGYNEKTGNVEIEIGKHQDNQGNWLPRSLNEMQKKYSENPAQFSPENPYDKYINRDFLKMKDANTPEYRVLEALKKFHMEYQEDLDNNQKLGYELPRYRRDNFEYLLGAADDGFLNRSRAVFKGLRDQWITRKDDYEEGINYEDDWAYTHGTSIFAPDGKPIPLGGRYKIDHDQVSVDIMQSMMRHMYAIEMHKELKETQPVAHAFKSLMENYTADDVINVQRSQYPNMPIVTGEGNKKRRKQAVDAMYKTWWEGQQMEKLFGDKEKGMKGVKTVNNLLALASHSFFAFDITSALKNYYGAQFQVGMEAAAGKSYYNPITKKKEKMMNYKDYALGRVWAAKANGMIGLEIYKKTSKSLELQLMEIFDPMQGRMEDKFGNSISRSLARDAASLTWTTSHRKYFENLGTLQLFSGIMHSVRIPQKIGNDVQQIRYIDAWQVNDKTGTIELKEGIDKTYGMQGEMFKMYRNRIHEISNFNQGMYSAMDSPQANRYLMYRTMVSMRKFFLKMYLQRWSYKGRDGAKWYKPWTWDRLDEKWNAGLQEHHMGHYAMTMRTMARIVQSQGNYALHMTPDERQAAFRTVLEPIKAAMIWYLAFMLFDLWDWDPEDGDRFKKLRERSGAMPLPGVADDYLDDEGNAFNAWGWTQNQALLTIMNVNQENQFFLPTSLMDQYNVIEQTSVTNVATIKAYIDVMGLMYGAWTGDKDASYQKDGGAMWYLRSGENKYWKLLNRMVGIKGKIADPETSIRNIEKFVPEINATKYPQLDLFGGSGEEPDEDY